VSLGALVHRLDPGIIPFRKATECAIHVSGGEFNVAANLADCFRLKTGIATAMVDYPIGDLIAERVRAMGVQPFYKRFAHDGVRGPNMATVYSDRGQGVRAPVVFYNRSNEAAALLKPGDFDWAGDLRRRRALVPQRRHLRRALPDHPRGDHRGHEGGQGGRRRRLLRPQLPREALEDLGRRRARPVETAPHRRERGRARRQRGGPAEGPRHSRARGAAKSKLDPSAFFGMIDRSSSKHPQVKIVATTLREVHSTNRHSWSAVAWIDGKTCRRPPRARRLDRVGGGDGFASGFFYGLLTGEEPRRRCNSAGRTARCSPQGHADGQGRQAGGRLHRAAPALHLEPGDILIDGGNSHFPDTIRRTAYVESKGLLYIGTGVSGGEEGALQGPSIMPGGNPEGLAAREAHLPGHRRQGRRRHALLRLGRARRRRPLRQDGPQRHRVRRHAAHLRGLPPDEGAWA
jgi:2-dehydro-3-deoxygluconokinase